MVREVHSAVGVIKRVVLGDDEARNKGEEGIRGKISACIVTGTTR